MKYFNFYGEEIHVYLMNLHSTKQSVVVSLVY